jgi:hypothetical protein
VLSIANVLSDAGSVTRDVGGLVAALVALYIGVVRDRWRRPSLSLHLKPGDLVSLGTHGTPIAQYARLRVRNKRGRRSAQNVEVLVTAFRCLGDPVGRPPVDTLPLIWSSLPGP